MLNIYYYDTMIYMDLSTFTTEQLEALSESVRNELNVRSLMTNAAQMSLEASRAYHGAELKNLPEGEAAEWRQPSGAHDAYPKGWPVRHNGKNWVSLTGANVWEPGVSSWREVTSDSVYPDWIQPTGAHDAYKYEDVVWHNGGAWRSTVNGNIWEPGQYGWEFIGEELPDPGAEDPGGDEEPVEPDPEEPTDPDPVDPEVPEDPEPEPEPEPEPDIEVWVQPTGAHDAYANGAVVSHNDKVWINTVDANTYEPGVYGWNELA